MAHVRHAQFPRQPRQVLAKLRRLCKPRDDDRDGQPQVNRSWNRLIGRWADFKRSIADKGQGEATTSETRDCWLQPLFQELGYGQRLPLAQPVEVDGRPYAISHGWSHVPIHLVGSHADLDRRTPGATGAAKASPHSLVQQMLNASEGHLWGIVSNGMTFRLLRDNVALTRLSYIEWDLATIFDGELEQIAHRNYFTDGTWPGFSNAFLLSGDPSFINVLRRQMDNIYAQKKIVDGKIQLPQMYGDPKGYKHNGQPSWYH